MADLVRDLLADDDGDLAVVNGDLALVAGAAAVPQGIACRTKLLLGEVWLDEEEGVDWLGVVLVKAPDLLLVREELRAPIAATPDVVEVVGIVPIVDANREATASYTVRTSFSTTPVTGTIEGP